MITPLFNRVLVKPAPKKETVLSSGLIVSTTAYDKTEEVHGEVIACGEDCKYVKVGNTVSFPAYGYDTVTANDGSGEVFMSVREPDVLAIITN